MATAGFSAYLPGPPDVELEFLGETGHLAVRCIVPAPRHPLPVVPTDTEGRDWRDAAREAIEAAPPGRVLALGVRTGRAEDDRSLREKFPNREVIGVDIHPGIGVDLVADVHELDLAAGVASAAIVYSGSLLEHVAAPWLVARACATVLVPGGYALHHAPWAWPTHARPNDFWRMSPDGLRQLFTPMLGFEVVETGSSVDVRMQVEPHPFSPDDPRLPLLAFSTTHSAATSWIIARKTTEPPAVTEWPYTGTEVAALAARYPVDGIAVSSD
ncbi:methyltransferase domain-containing protein [Microcella sp.]|uniref:methyltransferase domain-containing protein n=1 Tax=Microcella sp. TaxID=1913979 RepID=UPI00256614CE|nr:class I SAM-dependent methyltransferase [Microcella sp.]MBX9470820.1 class I SAM-dependent methyltransferase [Microcella sp.]